MADTAKKETPKVFRVVNTVRRVGTRMHRAKSARRQRWQLWIAGQRLLRNKELRLTEEAFRNEESNILTMLKSGEIALVSPDNVKVTTTPDGQFVLTKSTGATKMLAKGEIPSCFSPTLGKVAKPVAGPPPAPEPAPAPAPAPAPEPQAPKEHGKPQDLTELPHVGAGRARKMEASGVDSFAKVVERGAKGLINILGVTPDLAEDIVDAAKKRI